MEITKEKFFEKLCEIIDSEDQPACVLLSIPGIYEILSEYYMAQAIEEIEEEAQERMQWDELTNN